MFFKIVINYYKAPPNSDISHKNKRYNFSNFPDHMTRG